MISAEHFLAEGTFGAPSVSLHHLLLCCKGCDKILGSQHPLVSLFAACALIWCQGSAAFPFREMTTCMHACMQNKYDCFASSRRDGITHQRREEHPGALKMLLVCNRACRHAPLPPTEIWVLHLLLSAAAAEQQWQGTASRPTGATSPLAHTCSNSMQNIACCMHVRQFSYLFPK